jgi:hypothetical protein
MQMNTTLKMLGALSLSLLASGVLAAVSEQEAAKLGSSLTPLGGEMAGNAAGSIPRLDGRPGYRRRTGGCTRFSQ